MKKTSLLLAIPLAATAVVSASALLLSVSPVHAQGKGIDFTWKSYIAPTSIESLLLAILNIFIIIATPIVVLFIIYAGFLYVTARGNAQQVQQATRALTYAIIGGVIIIGAVAIAAIISGVVGSFTP